VFGWFKRFVIAVEELNKTFGVHTQGVENQLNTLINQTKPKMGSKLPKMGRKKRL